MYGSIVRVLSPAGAGCTALLQMLTHTYRYNKADTTLHASMYIYIFIHLVSSCLFVDMFKVKPVGKTILSKMSNPFYASGKYYTVANYKQHLSKNSVNNGLKKEIIKESRFFTFFKTC